MPLWRKIAAPPLGRRLGVRPSGPSIETGVSVWAPSEGRFAKEPLSWRELGRKVQSDCFPPGALRRPATPRSQRTEAPRLFAAGALLEGMISLTSI
jgi:hypothetical protein